MTLQPSVAIRRVARLGSGHTPSRQHPEYWENCTIPWFTLADVGQIRDGTTSVVNGTSEMVSEVGLARSAAELHPAGTVIMSRTASVGFTAILGRDMATSQDFATWTCGPLISPRYLLYSLRGQPQEIEARKTGSTHKTIYMPDIETLRTPLPSLQEQERIADYLDSETSRINTVVGKKRRMVELLEERLWETVAHEIGALDVGNAPLRRFLLRISDGPFGSSLTSAHYVDAGARVVRLGNIGFAEFKAKDEAFISMEHYAGLTRHRVVEGDLLIAGLGDARHHVGRACVAPDLGEAIVKADCYCAKVDTTRASSEFLSIFLSCPLGAGAVGAASRGTTRSRINLDIAMEIEVPLVPLETQERLVASFLRRRRNSHRTVMLLERQIALLIEHRQALITAAVTGELDIPDLAA